MKISNKLTQRSIQNDKTVTEIKYNIDAISHGASSSRYTHWKHQKECQSSQEYVNGSTYIAGIGLAQNFELKILRSIYMPDWLVHRDIYIYIYIYIYIIVIPFSEFDIDTSQNVNAGSITWSILWLIIFWMGNKLLFPLILNPTRIYPPPPAHHFLDGKEIAVTTNSKP